MKKCIFAGTFDPPTLGHKFLIEAGLSVFDEVIVAFLINPAKAPYFSIEERKEMLRLTVDTPRIRVVEWSGTVAELAKREDAPFYLRGIRNSIDLDYENANYYASKKLNSALQAVYLPCPQELLHVSSTMVRNSLHFKTPIDSYVTAEVKSYIEERESRKE